MLFGCNLCNATPVAYQTNMLIMSAGDHRFAGYTRTALPLGAIMTAIARAVTWSQLRDSKWQPD